MRRLTGLPEAAEWGLVELFLGMRVAQDRGPRIQFPGLTWITTRYFEEPYLQFTAGPVTVLGFTRPDYLFVDPCHQFEDVRFAPTAADCRVDLTGNRDIPPVRIYPDDPGPWWEILAAALPAWQDAFQTALADWHHNSGREQDLANAAASCQRHQRGSQPLTLNSKEGR